MQETKRSGRSSPPRICLVTREIVGPEKGDDEIGAINGLAQALSSAGNDVTLLWTPWRTEVSDEELTKRRQHCAYNHLIHLDVLEKSDRLLPLLWTIESQSLALYHYLSGQQFDAVIVQLEGGLAYYSLLAIETGVFHNPPPIIVVAHAPLDWSGEADRFFLGGIGQVTTAFMEKYCAEQAEHLACSSTELLAWMRRKDWKVSKSAKVIAPLVPWEWRPIVQDELTTLTQIDEIVLLTGPKYSEGAALFCDAVDSLVKAGVRDLTITAFGPFGRILGEHTGGMVLRRSKRWPYSLKLFSRMSFRERIDYVKRPGLLAIVPALDSATGNWVSACVDAGVPFIATDVGANTQFVAEKDRASVLARPRPGDIAALIKNVLATPVRVRPQRPAGERRNAWSEFTAKVIKQSKRRKHGHSKAGKREMVSIVMAHYNRPQYLPQAIEAIEAQTYPNIELIIVDDGSDQPAAIDLLKRLEAPFKKKGWRILRQANKYLGAARNAGIRASRGKYVLFADDDNALFPEAVETFVNALETSGADICTGFQMLFYEEFVPKDRRAGLIQYLTLGHCLELGLLHDVFGDANAIIRRSVFDQIGYQNETYGFIAQDWEFFTRAVIAGLKLRLVPEPLYWYRSNTEAMYRSSHWYDTRLPIIDVFKKHGFLAGDHLYHLLLAQNVGPVEMEGYRENLRHSVSGAQYLELSHLDPNSQDAIELLARIAASEGRADAALMLLSGINSTNLGYEARKAFELESAPTRAIRDLGSGLLAESRLEASTLQEFTVAATTPGDPLFYVQDQGQLVMGSNGKRLAVAVLASGYPAGAVSISANVSLESSISSPMEVLLLSAPLHVDPVVAAQQQGSQSSEGSSGWVTLAHDWELKEIGARRTIPETMATNLIVAVRPKGDGAIRDAAVCLQNFTVHRKLGADILQRPRLGPPPHRQRARSLTDDEIRQAHLLTKYSSERPLLMFASNGGGIFLRPHPQGPVAAALKWQFPAFARRVVAKVEVAHDDAADFDFALALSRSDDEVIWESAVPGNTIAFSGWKRVESKFTLNELEVEIGARMKIPLTINIAVRLPWGANANPSNAFFRKLIVAWAD